MITCKGLFITGVDTEIGKTTVASAIAGLLADKGYTVGVLKPAQSGAESINGELVSQDARIIAKMAGVDGPDHLLAPYLFEKPVSPYHAAKEEGVAIDLEVIVDCFNKLAEKNDIVIVEGAGGILAPLTKTAVMGDIASRLQIPALVVAHPFLGSINHTLMTVLVTESFGVDVVGVIFNQHKNEKYPKPDFDLITEKSGVAVLGFLPFAEDISDVKKIKTLAKKHIDVSALIEKLTAKSPSGRQKALEAKDKKYVWHPFTQMSVWRDEPVTIIESGRGVVVRDVEGNEYIDSFSSYWCNVHGHGEKRLSSAMQRQASKISHSTFLGFSNEPAVELAEKLVEITPDNLTKVFYSDNGSTAVEVAVKMAYQYWRHVEKDSKRSRFLALNSAYHGDTVGAMSVGGVDLYHSTFRDILFPTEFVPPPYCYRCPIGKTHPDCDLACADLVDKALSKSMGEVAAMIIEPMVQCPGGIITAPDRYLKKVSDICKRHDVLLIADEVAVGFGRTGKMFAVEHEDVAPDIMALSKSITSGTVPFAATMTTEKIYDAFLGSYESQKTFFHGHTYTANQIGTAVALENLKLYEERSIVELFQTKAIELADLLAPLKDFAHVGDVRQRGLIAGIELVVDKESKKPYKWEERVGMKVCAEAKSRGLLIRPLGNVLVLFPAPVITKNELARVVDIVKQSIVTVTEGKA